MNWRRENKKGSQSTFKGLDNSAKGNPFTTPKGYFDDMSSDILKTVAGVSLLALFRLKPLQFAIGIVATIAVGTAIYLFTSNGSDQSGSSSHQIVQQQQTVEPRVILQENDDQAVTLIPATEEQQPDIVSIDPDAEAKEVLTLVHKLPLSKESIQHIVNQYVALKSDFPEHDSAVDDSHNETQTVYNNLVKNNSDDYSSKSLSAFALLPRDTCSESAFTLNAYMPGENRYSWSTGATTSSIDVTKSGNYRITVTLADNSVMQKTVAVKIIPRPDLSNDYLITACAGASLRLSVNQKNSGYQYLWPQYNLSAPQMTVSKPGLYFAQVKGCEVYVDSFFVVFSHCELGIPNMVTPNGDGMNETFVITNLNRYPNTQLSIFNRSNQLIFKSENYQNDWNASSTPDGSYFYILKFTDGTTEEGLITVKH